MRLKTKWNPKEDLRAEMLKIYIKPRVHSIYMLVMSKVQNTMQVSFMSQVWEYLISSFESWISHGCPFLASFRTREVSAWREKKTKVLAMLHSFFMAWSQYEFIMIHMFFWLHRICNLCLIHRFSFGADFNAHSACLRLFQKYCSTTAIPQSDSDIPSVRPIRSLSVL